MDSTSEVEGVRCLLPAGLTRNGLGTVEALTIVARAS